MCMSDHRQLDKRVTVLGRFLFGQFCRSQMAASLVGVESLRPELLQSLFRK
jgi:hypothetical protein